MVSKKESKAFADQWVGKFWSTMDRLTADLIQSNQVSVAKPQGGKASKTRLLSPEDEVKQLITTASSLEDIWNFFLKRLKAGSGLDFLCFSCLDESEDFIRVRFLYPECEDASDLLISMNARDNHLVKAYLRKDTTFSPSAQSLGEELSEFAASETLNIFSVPFIASSKAIAMITLGFAEMDAFSQAKLSYVYTLRDQVAQLVWNLVLQDRMKLQAQIDNLTGLLSYSYFQQVLENEIERAHQNQTSVTVMILDINNIQEINQRLGHTVGDEAICYLASTVRRLIRGLDTVARYGGDEVVVVLPETDTPTADEIAERFIQGFQARTPEGLEELSVSVGYATYPDDTRQKDSVLKLAEQALHLAKFKGEKTAQCTRIASHEMEQLNEKTVLEVFASHVAKKYNNIHVPSVYQDLLLHFEKKPLQSATAEDLMLETITSLAGALDAKDKYTRGHSQAVANYAVALAHALHMAPHEVEEIRLAAFLHDIGKIGIPEEILCKKGPLNEKEWEIMKQHPVIGAHQILAPVTSLKPIIPAVLHHHENWDGSGHPYNLKGEKIPVGARVVSLVDAFHALTSDRSYRKAMTVQEAKVILQAGCGTKWDPYLIEVFFKILAIASPKKSATPVEEAPEPGYEPVQLKLTS